MPPTTLKRSPVAVCLFLSASIAACELASPTLSLCVAAARRTGKPVSLSASIWVALHFFLSGARVSLRLSVGVGLNPGDIRWRDARSCHYPCGEAHHHPTAERRSARQPRKTMRERERKRETAVTALRLQENCDDHAKKKKKKYTRKKARDLRSLSMRSSAKMAASQLQMLKSILQQLLIIAGPVLEYLELIEMCKISNRIDSRKWKSSVNIPPQGRGRRYRSYSVFAEVVWVRGGWERIWVGVFFFLYTFYY